MEQNEHQEPLYEEPFPYKTYDEIQLEKLRRIRFRQGMVMLAGVFLLFSTVIVGISLIWRSAVYSSLSTGDATPDTTPGQLNQTALSANREEPLPSQTEVRQTQALADESNGIYVTDVSKAVKNARPFVVGILAENYAEDEEDRTGSGVVLSENGYILTGSRFLKGCDSIHVTLSNGKSYAAFIMGSDECSGLAVLKINAHGLTALKVGNSDEVETGQAAIAMGADAGETPGSVTFGIVSGVNRNLLVSGVLLDLLQTDAALDEGNTGGALLNERGEVIGINACWISIHGRDKQDFVIAINDARSIASALIQNGQVAGRPVLGIEGTEITQAAAGLNLPRGILISSVDAGSGAALAGLRPGDVITQLGDTVVKTMEEAYLAREKYHAGDWVKVTYSRAGALNTVKVLLGDQLEHDGIGNF